jgi:hypothetical protein
LVSAEPSTRQFATLLALGLAMGVLDRASFLALRPEHFLTTIACFLFAQNWISGAKDVQLALWFFAGFSKLNHHFPTVVGVMVSNSPLTPFSRLRKLMYRDFPRDLRPSNLANWMGHAGTLLELSVPVVLLFASGGTAIRVGLVMMLALHAFITSNVPMGVPLEWNAMVVYGAFALFWAHPEVRAWEVHPPWFAVLLAVVLVGVPLLGNVRPARVSFLLAMRYYAGNWAYSIWLFRGDSRRKLQKLTTTSPWVHDQLERFYDPATAIGIVGKVIGFRLMHLHGRALPRLLPRAVDRFGDYEYVDGEIIGGLALGWNFGDGHLHREPLLRAIQSQCHFEPGELRCIFVEAQPLGRASLAYRIVDAATGMIEQGELPIAELRAVQPWST